MFSYLMERVQGVSTNNFRLPPQNSDSATANQQIRFSLPTNCLLNTRSVKILFNAQTTGFNARLPANIASLIDRYEILAGGVQISQGFSLYNVLVKAKESLQGSKCDAVLGHKEIVRQRSYVNGTEFAHPDPETYNKGDDPRFAVGLDEGFFGSVEPGIVDLALLPDLTLIIHLANNNVCTNSPGLELDGTRGLEGVANTIFNFTDNSMALLDPPKRNVTFSISDIRLTCEVIGLASSLYDQLIAKRIADVGFVPLNFKAYQSYMDTHNGDTKWSIACQSLDRVWVAYRAANYNQISAPVWMKGFKKAGAIVYENYAADNTKILDVGIPDYDHGGYLNTNQEKYRGVYFNFIDRASGKTTYQMLFNGSMMPQYAACPAEMYQISMNSIEHTYNENMSLDQYRYNNFVQCWRLCLPGNSVRVLSGTDTRGINLQASLRTTGLLQNTDVVIFAEHTSTLKIGANRAIEVVL